MVLLSFVLRRRQRSGYFSVASDAVRIPQHAKVVPSIFRFSKIGCGFKKYAGG